MTDLPTTSASDSDSVSETSDPYSDIWHLGDSTARAFDETPKGVLTPDDVLAAARSMSVKKHQVVFDKGRRIVYGGYGKVRMGYLHVHAEDNLLVAVKVLRMEGSKTEIRFAREIFLWADLKHPNIVPLVGFYYAPGEDAWLISPYCVNLNVIEYLNNAQPSFRKRLDLLLDTAHGLEYLHTQDRPMCHGDLKGANVVVNHLHRAMLCDFGISKVLKDPSESTGVTVTTSNKGTTRYLSPELAHPTTASRPSGSKNLSPPKVVTAVRTLQSDMWAWGCVALEILSDRAPFHELVGDGHIYLKLDEGSPPDSLEHVDLESELKNLIGSCWNRDPRSRPEITVARRILKKVKKRQSPQIAKGTPPASPLPPVVPVNLPSQVLEHPEIILESSNPTFQWGHHNTPTTPPQPPPESPSIPPTDPPAPKRRKSLLDFVKRKAPSPAAQHPLPLDSQSLFLEDGQNSPPKVAHSRPVSRANSLKSFTSILMGRRRRSRDNSATTDEEA